MPAPRKADPVGPHETPLQTLDEAASLPAGTLAPVIELFEKASVAEMYSLGHVARERIDAVETLRDLIESASTSEYQLQRLIESAPWILYPEWTPLTRNQTLESLRHAFQSWYFRNTAQEIVTTSINSAKRPDFVMLSYAGCIEILEIKRPGHTLTDDECQRALDYRYTVMDFLSEGEQLTMRFPRVRLTIICDKRNFSNRLYGDTIERNDDITLKTWATILHDTTQAHQDFLSRVRELHGALPL